MTGKLMYLLLGLASVQLGGSLMWLLIERPGTKEVHPLPLTAVLTCGVSNLSLVLSLLYNMLLIILCTFYAFKTRKIPENFNEAKYIGFTMYSTCIVWLAFVAIYFGTYNDYKVYWTCWLPSLLFIYFFYDYGCRSRRQRCAFASTSALRWHWAAYLSPKFTSFSSSRIKMSAHREVGWDNWLGLSTLMTAYPPPRIKPFIWTCLSQVQRAGDHHRGLNKFSGGGGGVGATASNSQQPLTSSHPLPMSSSATQSMTSLSRFVPSAAAGVSSTALSTISGGGLQQANGNDNQSRAEAERDSNNLS